jgi:hypothetical protein
MTDQMLMLPHPAVRARFSDRRLAVKSILGFWFFYALTVVVRAFLGSDPWTTLEHPPQGHHRRYLLGVRLGRAGRFAGAD